MSTTYKPFQWLVVGVMIIFTILFTIGCSAGSTQGDAAVSETTSAQVEMTVDEHENSAGAELIMLPELEAAELNDAPLKVVATTSIIGDVIAQVGGDVIELTTLIGVGQDAHSYEPVTQDLTAVTQAHAIFINGWDLEGALVHDLEEIGADVPLVAISANIEPLVFGEDEGEQEHSSTDPHVWFSIHHVEQWVENVAHVLSDLDPANAETYASNAAAYLVELETLAEYAEVQLAQIPEENRFLVTNHDSFSYFASDYGFELIGTIIPAASTLAEPSASDLASLIGEMEAHGLCTIFTETSVSGALAQTVVSELDGCDEVKVLPLYTESIGVPGSGADSYIGMFRANVDAIVEGLK